MKKIHKTYNIQLSKNSLDTSGKRGGACFKQIVDDISLIFRCLEYEDVKYENSQNSHVAEAKKIVNSTVFIVKFM